MKLLLISLWLVILAVQVFCQESTAPTQVGETSEVPASAITTETQSVQEASETEDKKLTKRSYGLGHWEWPEYHYGWPWPGWGHGGGFGIGFGGYGGHGGGWHGGWYGGHGWPWWYGSHGSHGSHGWHGKW